MESSVSGLAFKLSSRRKVPSRELMTSALAVMSQRDHCCHPPPVPDTVGPSCEIRHLVRSRVKLGGVKRPLAVQNLQVRCRSSLVAESGDANRFL